MQKKFGRVVQNFDEDLWKKYVTETAYEVVKQKAQSDEKLKELLKATGNRIIAEMTKNDAIWGTGHDIDSVDEQRFQAWVGTNFLGEAWMRVREELFDVKPCRPSITATDTIKTEFNDGKDEEKPKKEKRWK